MGGGYNPPKYPRDLQECLDNHTDLTRVKSHPAYSHCPHHHHPPSKVHQTFLCFSCSNLPYQASRNFLRRLGLSWLRRRRNHRSTWRPESPLCRDSCSTSTWCSEEAHCTSLRNSAVPDTVSPAPCNKLVISLSPAFPFLHPPELIFQSIPSFSLPRELGNFSSRSAAHTCLGCLPLVR